MYSLIKYGDNCSKTTRRLCKYYRDKSFLNAIADFPAENNNRKWWYRKN